MNNPILTIGIVGAGSRLREVYGCISAAANGRARIARFFDTHPSAAALLRELPGGEGSQAAASWSEVIQDPAIHAVMIGTPNAFHADPAIAAMEAGKALYLEKPLAATLDDHHRLMATQRRTGARVALGFVLRHTPFFRALKELVVSGRLGRLLVVQAVEHMDAFMSADVYLRGWRAYRRIAGPLLLEKCSHDIDIINWLVDAPCETVTAFSDQTVFVADPSRPARCPECRDAACPYRAVGGLDDRTLAATGRALHLAGDGDACVYNRGQDIADHTTLLARYGGGVHVSFNVTMGVPRGTRRIQIIGSRGSVTGCVEEDVLVFQSMRAGASPETTHPAAAMTGSHYGGDAALATEFVALCRGAAAGSCAGIAEGYESGLVCLAAEESAQRGQPVTLASLRSPL